MWSTNERRNNKMMAFADTGYLEAEQERHPHRKCSCISAMLLGVILTLEIMVAGGMLFNVDFHAADTIALVMIFVVLYFGVVAVLTDK